jgi:hypothetical protein
MTPTPLFCGRVLQGGLLVLDRPKDYAKHLRSLAGQYVEIVARKRRTKRSLDQNAYIHVAATLASEHTGYTLAEVKLIWMGECWGWHTVAGHELPVKPHTSDMTVDEASYFIDWVGPWSLEHMGVEIPPPERVAA